MNLQKGSTYHMDKHNDPKINWNYLDKLIAKLRYLKVNKYIKANNIIVDIGCGQKGEFLLSHKNQFKKGYGLDHKISSHIVDNIEFINNKKLKQLPIPKNSVDVVFLNAVLEHLQNPKAVLGEALSVLKNDGKIVMTTPTPLAKPILEIMAYKLHIINEAEIKEHVHYYTYEDILYLIKELNDKFPVKLEKYEKFEFGVNSLIVIQKFKN